MILPLFSWGGARPCAVPLRVLSSVSFLPGPVSYNTIAVTSEMDVRGTSDLDVRGTPHRSEAVYSHRHTPPTLPTDTPVSPHFPTQLTTGPVAPSAVFTVSRRGPRLALGHRSATPGRVQTSRFNTARVSPRMRRRIVHTLAHITSHNPCRKLHVATFTFRHRKHTFPHSGQSQLCNPIPCFEPASATWRRGEHFHGRQTIPCFEPASTTGRRIAPMIAHRVTGPARQ